MQVERLERHVQADRIILANWIGAGAYEGTLPDLEETIMQLDEALNAPPETIDKQRQELLEALGLIGA